MIRICRKGKTHLSIRGHAGSGPRGHDLVCAAVSALALTLAEGLKDMEQPVIRLQPGDTELCCVIAPEAVQAFDCICRGFQLLAEMYPEYLQTEAQ